MRLIASALALAAALFLDLSNAALAQANLDPASHDYLSLIAPNKVRYLPGEAGTLEVVLLNDSGSTLTGGSLSVEVQNDGVVVTTHTAAIPTLANAATATVSMPITAPAGADGRGYRVEVNVLNASATVIDSAMSAIDVGTDPHRYPRHQFITNLQPNLNVATENREARAWGITHNQYYDAQYRHHQAAPPAGLSQWPAPNHQNASWPGAVSNMVSRATINAMLAADDAARIQSGLYTPIYGADIENYAADGVTLRMMSFARQCSTANPCTEMDVPTLPVRDSNNLTIPDNYDAICWTGTAIGTPFYPGLGSCTVGNRVELDWQTHFGWQLSRILIANVTDSDWRNRLSRVSIRPAIVQFPSYDFVQGDIFGTDDRLANRQRWDWQGRPLNNAIGFGDFVTSLSRSVGRPVAINTVTGEGFVDVALTSAVPFVYRETWDFEGQAGGSPVPGFNTFPGLMALVGGSEFSYRRYTTRAVVLPMYPQRLNDSGTFREPQALQLEAVTAMAGADWMSLVDGGRGFTNNVFVPGFEPPHTAAGRENRLRARLFNIAVQQHTRNPAVGGAAESWQVGGANVSTVGAAGNLWILGTSGPGVQIGHVINLLANPTNFWSEGSPSLNDSPTAQVIPAASLVTGRAFTMYYLGLTQVAATGRLRCYSPDTNNGEPQVVTYTRGGTPGAYYIQGTIPDFRYRSMCVLRTAASADEYGGILATEPIRATWSDSTSNGVTRFATVARLCCGQVMEYRRVAFTAAHNSLVLFSAQPTPSVITFRLDSPTGPVVASCGVPATANFGVGTETTCGVSGVAAGTRRLFVSADRPVALYSFRFAGP